MKLQNLTVIRWVAFFVALAIRAWLATLRVRVRFSGNLRHPTSPDHERYIYTIWHEAFMGLALMHTRIHVLISQHRDGEFITQVCRFLRVGVVRGSTTRGGMPALHEMIQVSKTSHLLVTPDGPRGPRRRVQTGTVFLASQSGLPIVFIATGFSNAWRARSWDRFAVPLPGSTIYAMVSEPITIPPDLDRAELERYRAWLTDYLGQWTAQAEAWAERNSRPTVKRRLFPSFDKSEPAAAKRESA